MKNLWLDCWHLVFPHVCACCGNYLVSGEEYICLDCSYELPRTNYHQYPENPIEQLFWGRVPIERATAWCHYAKGGRVQTLLYRLKYKNDPGLGVFLGQQMALEMPAWFSPVTALIPVPLHPKKLRSRGYNQSERVGQGLAEITHLPLYPNALIRTRANLTQTHKGVYARWENAQGLFALNQAQYPLTFWRNQHVVLVDDVITTGATVASCAEVLVKVGAKVSILAVAASLPEAR